MLWFPFINRANLSPFTKDYRGEEQLNELKTNFWIPTERWAVIKEKQTYSEVLGA